MKFSIKLLQRILGKQKLLQQVFDWLLQVIAAFYPRLWSAIKEAVMLAEGQALDGRGKFAYAWDRVREQFDDAEDYKWIVNFAIETYVGTLISSALKVSSATPAPPPRFKRLLDCKDGGCS